MEILPSKSALLKVHTHTEEKEELSLEISASYTKLLYILEVSNYLTVYKEVTMVY